MDVSAEVLDLHRRTLVVDLHADTPSLMRVGYDLFARHRPPPRHLAYGQHVDVPRMRDGGLWAQVFSIVTIPFPSRGCMASAHRQVDLLERAASAHPEEISIARTAEDVVTAHGAGRRAALLSIEGAHALEGRLENLGVLAARGIRSIGLLHFWRNPAGCPAYGWGSSRTTGLTDFGRDLVDEANRLGVLVDLAHVNRPGFLEAAARTRAPPIVSHTGVTGVFEHWRNIDDEQIRAVADKGGCIGVIFAPRYLGRDGVAGVVDHIEYLVQKGGEEVAALGSDFDGLVRPPDDLPDVSALPRLTAEMLRRGWAPGLVEKVLGANFLRVLGSVATGAVDEGGNT